MPHIMQIACLDAESKDTFSAYVLPKTQLDPNAERATGNVFLNECGSFSKMFTFTMKYYVVDCPCMFYWQYVIK